MDGYPSLSDSVEDHRRMHSQRKSLPDFRAPSNGVPVPRSRPAGMNNGNHGPGNLPRGNGFMSRSPPSTPNNKNTKHVPCKFFRQGTCTAGDACPYSHANQPLEPCKFFLNGNCKYGPRCALPHILDGRIINPQCFTAGNRARNPHNAGPTPRQMPLNAYPPMSHDQSAPFPSYGGTMGSQSMGIPLQFDQQGDFGSLPGSPYGSPNQDGRMPMSPAFKGFSALDAPLPGSYNSQDVPNIAKFGPNATSVPVKSGWGPLTSTSPTTSTASNQAFGNLDTLTLGGPHGFGSSPPRNSNAEAQPRRIMHSDKRSLFADPVSASMPLHAQPPEHIRAFRLNAPMADHEEEEGQGEEFLPSSLSDLLTEKEKMRRFSRSEEDHNLNHRPSISSFGSPGESKVGSPPHASPSRFGAFFASQARKEALEPVAHPGSSPFGHVGSPLRNSTFGTTAPNTKGRDFSGSPSFGPISPPRSNDRKEFVSSLSEQLKGMRVSSQSQSKLDNPEHLQIPSASTRPTSDSRITPALPSASQMFRRELVASGNGITARADDEPGCVFSMEDDLDLGSGERRRGPASGMQMQQPLGRVSADGARPR